MLCNAGLRQFGLLIIDFIIDLFCCVLYPIKYVDVLPPKKFNVTEYVNST
jgi:hypothetical protein